MPERFLDSEQIVSTTELPLGFKISAAEELVAGGYRMVDEDFLDGVSTVLWTVEDWWSVTKVF